MFEQKLKSLVKSSAYPGLFVLCIASTYLSDIEGLSAAGANNVDCRNTPKWDSEYLLNWVKTVPVSPMGIVSPVIITKAGLSQLNLDIQVVNCGVFSEPQMPHLKTSGIPSFKNKLALPIDIVHNLYHEGLEYANLINKSYEYIIIAECVPGGTTTAAGVLSLQGLDIFPLMASSFAQNNQELKTQIIKQKLKDIDLADSVSPLAQIAGMGDSMQAFVLGLSLGLKDKLIVLAGGTQMLAIWSMLKAIMPKPDLTNLAVFTTNWLATSNQGGFFKLAKMLDVNFKIAQFNFVDSPYPGLQAYENGHIKEGIGAGAILILLNMLGLTNSEIQNIIEREYKKIPCQ